MYYAREAPERANLTQMIDRSIKSEKHRQEVRKMGQTIAEALKEEGHQQGRLEGALTSLQQTLIRQMRKRFGSVPHKVSARIKATKDTNQLETWLDAFATADSIAEIGIE